MNHVLAAIVAVALTALAAPSAVRADDPPPPSSSQPGPARPDADTGASSAPASPAPEPTTVPRPHVKAPSSDLDFDLLGTPAQKADPALQRALERRRTMLSLHPALGLATWAALAATVVVGQLDFNDRFRGGGDTGKYHDWHTGLAIGSAVLFEGTLLLGLLAPKPFSTPTRVDTALLHKIAMGTATAGMVAQLVLGIVARGQAGSVAERRIASAHQIIGYGTLAAYTAGVVVFVF